MKEYPRYPSIFRKNTYCKKVSKKLSKQYVFFCTHFILSFDTHCKAKEIPSEIVIANCITR